MVSGRVSSIPPGAADSLCVSCGVTSRRAQAREARQSLLRNASRRGVIDNQHLTIRSGDYERLGFELERADHRVVEGPRRMRRELDIVSLPQHAEAVASGRQLIDQGGKARDFHVRLESSIPFPTAVLADAFRSRDPSDLRVAGVLYAALAALQSAMWIPIFSHLRDHLELMEPGTDVALIEAQRVRPWVGVGVDVAAGLAALMSPVAMLVLWTFSLIFFAVTSDGLEARWAAKAGKV